jgi:mono/diheme cytochrome c family protein
MAMLALTITSARADDVPAAAVTEGDQVWTTRCSLCHGPGGKANGPASARSTRSRAT